nr:RNA-directed DNA polymerase, eukaryota [Tanacetum cinerariifolium]
MNGDWVKWSKVLASKKFEGLGVSSFFALNRALLFKWVWRYLSRDNSLWYQVISAIHGLNKENKDILIADKLNSSLSSSFRHPVRGGEETQQFDELSGILASASLSSLDDRWFWDLSGDGTFQVKGVRSLLDETFLPKMDTPTWWIKNGGTWKFILMNPIMVGFLGSNLSFLDLSCKIFWKAGSMFLGGAFEMEKAKALPLQNQFRLLQQIQQQQQSFINSSAILRPPDHHHHQSTQAQMACDDAWHVCHPDFKQPFSSLEDACQRYIYV